MTGVASIRLDVLGARGGCPVSGAEFLRYGGDTTCFALETPDALLIFDAGTGIRQLNNRVAGWSAPKPIGLFLTHYHLDHISGLPAFRPLYDPRAEITVFGTDPSANQPWRDALGRLIAEPYWPVPLDKAPATIGFHDLDAHDRRMDLFGVRIEWRPVRHTQNCLAFRIRLPGGSVTLAPDQELPGDDIEAYRDFIRGSDILIQDAQYTPEEYPNRRGWGHSTWRDAAELAAEADIQHLLLFHHDPLRSDTQIDAIVDAAQAVFPHTRAASPTLQVHFPSPAAAPELVDRSDADEP